MSVAWVYIFTFSTRGSKKQTSQLKASTIYTMTKKKGIYRKNNIIYLSQGTIKIELPKHLDLYEEFVDKMQCMD